MDNHDIPGQPAHASNQSPTKNAHKKAQQLAQTFTHNAKQTLQQWTTRKYTLPDKNVASQVLMYRQLLHTNCRPGLKLSREFQGTPAQMAVKDMPWWTPGLIASEKKMVISYDDLITRLWLGGAIDPFSEKDEFTNFPKRDSETTLLTPEGLPPIPHDHWVHLVGFQQPDPVTDFRSGGVLSLASLVYIVESCPQVHARFSTGDAKVLPFGITSINVTDMMASFLMLVKKVDRMDALLSQKPFWKMFADPYALLTCHELAMDMLADVVVELYETRKLTDLDAKVTVFDFSWILEQTTFRVENDLLGAGPTSVAHVRSIHGHIKAKYRLALDKKLGLEPASSGMATSPTSSQPREVVTAKAQQIGTVATSLAGQATTWTGSVWNKIRSPAKSPGGTSAASPAPTGVTSTTTSSTPATSAAPTVDTDAKRGDNGDSAAKSTASSDDGDWQKDMQGVADGVTNFSIGDNESDEDEDL